MAGLLTQLAEELLPTVPAFAAVDKHARRVFVSSPGVRADGVFNGPPPPRRHSSHEGARQRASREFATGRWGGYR